MRLHLLVTLLAASCLAVDAPDRDDPALGVTDQASYTSTRYPIVLIHGLLGFDDLFGVISYFDGIPAALAAGGAEVFVVTASQAEAPEVRGEQLVPELEAILDETGAEKLNLVGHSLGSLDARYLAAVRPDLVASVTSVGGPHQGSPLAELVLAGGPLATGLFQAVADLLKLISGSDDPNDAAAAMQALTPAGAAAFNAAYPAALPSTPCGEGAPVVDGVAYYSWGGTGRMTNPFDPSDPMLLLLSLAILGPNDGLVPRCSTHLGDVIRDDYVQNHMDQTNLMLGLVGGAGPRPVDVYRDHAHRLQVAGL